METLLTISPNPNHETIRNLSHSYHILNANSIETASDLITQTACDGTFAEVEFLSSPLLAFIKKARQLYPYMPIICRYEQKDSPLTLEFNQIPSVYLTLKENSSLSAKETLDRAQKQLLLHQLAFQLQGDQLSQHPFSLVGESLGLRNLRNQVIQLATKEDPILILGEPGSGRKHTAHYIHSLSTKSNNFMVTVSGSELEMPNCYEKLFGSFDEKTQSLTPGKIDAAHSSTLLLEDFHLAPPMIKDAVVHLIREGYFYRHNNNTPTPSKAMILITGINSHYEADESYAALRTLLQNNTLNTLALSERLEDLPLLAYTFLQESRIQHASVMTNIHAKTLDNLRKYSWPRNLDQLRSVIDYAVLFYLDSPTLFPYMLPDFLQSPTTEVEEGSILSDYPAGLEEEVNKLQRRLIIQAMSEAGGRQVHAARLLKTTPRILNHRIKQLDIQTIAK